MADHISRDGYEPVDPPAPCRAVGNIECDPSCSWIFANVYVYPTINGNTRVEWVVHPSFSGLQPYTFQLQFGRTGNPLADDWVSAGDVVAYDTYQIDVPKRVYGKFQWSHYRVLLTTSDGVTYASAPQHALGTFGKRDWLRAREVKRMEALRLKQEAGNEGYLLKRRHFGEPCSCLDPLTKEIRDPGCLECYNTGIVQGYFEPVPCFYVEMGLGSTRSHLDESRGSVDDLSVTSGRMINEPQIFSYDVWVEKNSDTRWYIHTIKSLVEIRGVPLILNCEMRQAAFSEVIYKFPVS